MEEAKKIAEGIKKYLVGIKKSHLLSAVISELQKSNHELMVVESAVELLEAEKAEIEKLLKNKFGTVYDVSYQINPGLLGGVRINVGSMELDLSVLGKLEGSHEN
ncbi:hypothetical protein A2397_04410 [Candidatus Amesbacteria bacterium RIFOXYB1_FULL_44_23]|uniref:Uncharacterized protein n=1 Tax=Candidatus Amesbacteria bacterium RIFOXYB1_FULL_44_23 TaxID=1797263 RepID=A0A1F4ZUS9_9BACT|nr:MAG: hypothetical protein A2397_04410 [Candidatus Amesbacteria bacterium RIFOXYB1_FULL_44_23]